MMKFLAVKQAIVNTLGASAAGQFTVVGWRGHGRAAEQVRNRIVECRYTDGQFPKSAGRRSGDVQHSMTFTVGLYVSAAAKGNLAVINQQGASASQVAAAIAAFTEAAAIADSDMDALTSSVFEILMNACNREFGLPEGTVSNTWVESIQKNDPLEQGNLVVLTGNITVSCQVAEDVPGETPVVADGGISVVLDIDGDDVERTGVEIKWTRAGNLILTSDGDFLVDADGNPIIWTGETTPPSPTSDDYVLDSDGNYLVDSDGNPIVRSTS